MTDLLSIDSTKFASALLGPASSVGLLGAKFLVLAACCSSFLVLLFFLVPSYVCWLLSVVPDVLYPSLIYNENGSGRRKPAVAPQIGRASCRERVSTVV